MFDLKEKSVYKFNTVYYFQFRLKMKETVLLAINKKPKTNWTYTAFLIYFRF